MSRKPVSSQASLEALVETGMLKLEILHPGGLELTRELAELCQIQKDSRVLDVASGTGETACFLAERFGARVCGVDHSDEMIQLATDKARAKSLKSEFRKADAARLPFGDDEFDAAICECTLCLLDKEEVIGEMVRVVRPRGWIGMDDLFWKDEAGDDLKRTLLEIEGERPATLAAWRELFRDAGLVRINAVDRSEVMSRWMQDSRKQLGFTGQSAIALIILRRWGIRGLWRIVRSMRVFWSGLLGYVIVVGKKPTKVL